MKSNILTKYQKSNYNNDYFGTGKSKNAKLRWRRYLKKVAKRLFEKDLNKI